MFDEKGQRCHYRVENRATVRTPTAQEGGGALRCRCKSCDHDGLRQTGLDSSLNAVSNGKNAFLRSSSNAIGHALCLLPARAEAAPIGGLRWSAERLRPLIAPVLALYDLILPEFEGVEEVSFPSYG